MKKRFLQMVKKRVLSLRLFPLLVCSGILIPAVGWGQARTPEGVWTTYAANSFAGGAGTEEDPYQIASAEQLAKLSKDVSEGTSYQGNYFILTENIDLSTYRWVPIGIYKWMSNGTTINKSFQGFLDGNYKTISGMFVDETTDHYCGGLFGKINIQTDGSSVGVKNLTITGATVYVDETGLEQCSGAILAGHVLGSSTQSVVFENITVSGSVHVTPTNGNNDIGGMLGLAGWVKATNCHAENVSISGGSNSGGFVGNDGGSVYENCTASGTIDGTWALGGFVGYSSSAVYQSADGESTYTKCAADVDVSGNDWRLGGFVGYAENGEFNNCVAYGNVDSSVDGWKPKVGGFMGECGSAIATNCHAAGTVTSASSDYKAGGFVGIFSGGTLTDCSFDIEKNPTLNAAGEGDLQGDGVTGEDSSTILANICEDYFDDHQYSTEWTVDTEATCTTSGSKSHHCERCGAKRDITEIPALGHKWGEPVYTWNEDNTTCTATQTCENNDEHSQTAEATVMSEQTKSPTCTEMGETTYTATFSETWAETQITTKDIPATGHHYVNGTCTECGQRDPDYRPDPDPIYYNIYLDDVCEGVEASLSRGVVKEGNQVSVYVEVEEGYDAENLKVSFKRSLYGYWEEVEEGVQPGEYIIYNVYSDIYVKVEGAEKIEEPTGMEDIEGAKVYAQDGNLYVYTSQPQEVTIITMNGAIVKRERQEGWRSYSLPKGIYIIGIGEERMKIRN